MRVKGKDYRSVWFDADTRSVCAIDQTLLPHEFRIIRLETVKDVCRAICTMQVRGAPLIGATAALGMALALRQDASSHSEETAGTALLATRPTAVNLRWAVTRVRDELGGVPERDRAATALTLARSICDEDVEVCSRIGDHGLGILEKTWRSLPDDKKRLDVLTHCNAGWLATVDWGTALAPVYKAHAAGIPLHVWVDETRPRNQGAGLTAWELAAQGIPHTVIADSTSGHLMQHGRIDLCLVGSDRTTADGDVCNKIGTYMIALAARDNHVPFYVALPVSSIDWQARDGRAEIAIEERDASEVTRLRGMTEDGRLETVRITPQESPAANFAFYVTPSRLVKAIITEQGMYAAGSEGLAKLAADLRQLEARR